MNYGKSALTVVVVSVILFSTLRAANSERNSRGQALYHSGAGQEVISNENFKLAFTAEGLSSLKRTNDIYDTDYIIQNSSIGDVLITYKSAGDSDYSRLHSARLISAGKNQARYNIGLPLTEFISTVQPSASVRSRTLFALNDGAPVESSSSRSGGFFSFNPRRGSAEWVQYDFPKVVTVSAVEVYWMDDFKLDGPYRVPQSWKLLYRAGDNWRQVENPSGYGVELDKFNKVTFDPVMTNALRIELQLYEGYSGGIYEWKIETDEDQKILAEYEKQNTEIAKQIIAESNFEFKGSELLWTINIRNLSGGPMEIADVGLPLRFNTQYGWDKNVTYTQRVIRHFLIAGNGSFVFCMRTNAEPPYLLMTPQENTHLEYFDRGFGRGRTFTAYVHSKKAVETMIQSGGNWRQENTAVTLKPHGQQGDSVQYAFKFQWADGYDGVRDLLYRDNKFDVQVVPGMTVPSDLGALIALRTKNKIDSIKAEFPEKTKIEYIGEKQKDAHLYKVAFSKLGENLLTIHYDGNKQMPLEFFVTEPLETLIKKRAAFLVDRQQHRDQAKWYNGVYSDWDMKNRILRSADDRDGLSSWLTDACDDAGNARPAYVASKNVFFPNQAEIESVDYYIKNYLWDGMQCTEDEEYPYGIYGIPNWKVNRDSSDPGVNGKKHIWRIYDYPHIVLLYYRMYQIAKFYPEIKTELSPDEYLMRSYKTAVAYFTVPLAVRKWSAYDTPTMNEIVMNDLLSALDAEGKTEEAAELRKHWERKVRHFINDDVYLFGSEFAFDSTGFEATGAFAKYAEENLGRESFASEVKPQAVAAFMEKQIRLNIAARGWLETAYYYLGSDYRSGGGMAYTLSYMSQMGGWSIVDYALYYAKDPFPYLRLGYASYLSSWALLNSGTAESNYGYWNPGLENDGAAGGGFEPAAYARGWLGKSNARGSWYYSAEEDVGYNGAVRTSTTIVADDTLFGLIAYGGILTKKDDGVEVICRDGLRKDFHYIKSKDARLHVLLERDGFAADQPVFVSESFDKLGFTLENRAKSEHRTKLLLSGMPEGKYEITFAGKIIEAIDIKGNSVEVNLPVPAQLNQAKVLIERK
jgi:hypothetical protein